MGEIWFVDNNGVAFQCCDISTLAINYKRKEPNLAIGHRGK